MKNPETFCKLVAENFKPLEGAEVFSCRFVKRGGWAIIFLHEQTGTVAIHSDYGDWVFSWPANGRGPRTLKEFVCEGSYDYMAGKFTMSLRDVFDKQQTIKNIENEIAERQDSNPIIWNDDRVAPLKEWLDEEAPDSADLFYERAPALFSAILGDHVSEYFEYDRPASFYWLRDGVLPALVSEIRKTLPAKVKP